MSRHEPPEPVLTDIAFRFRMPDGTSLTVHKSMRGSNLSTAITSAQEEARTEALRQQDYARTSNRGNDGARHKG